jgi:hypothetical protein
MIFRSHIADLLIVLCIDINAVIWRRAILLEKRSPVETVPCTLS